MSGPLEGIRVCDLTIAQFGAHATMMLADMGADVVKIESPRGGDPGRGIALQQDGTSAFFLAHNRNKRSVAVNLRRPEGKDLARRLAARSDIFVQSWKPGVIGRLELDYDNIRRVKPDIIYASASGFGPRGPRAHVPAMHMVAPAVGGNAGGAYCSRRIFTRMAPSMGFSLTSTTYPPPPAPVILWPRVWGRCSSMIR